MIEGQGSGIILYLAQEGRGLGLANKMRAYQLQDDGLDTIDANTTLGFADDERDYAIAARMLRMLNCTRITLLTNNPAKLDGLAKAGIQIVSRMPLEAPVNADNRRSWRRRRRVPDIGWIIWRPPWWIRPRPEKSDQIETSLEASAQLD